MISIINLSRSYGSVKAVDNVSFSINSGEVVGLLGHNGAGKTTIMKILTGFIEPSGGTVKIDGLELGPDTQLIQKKIGYLPENCPVWPEMNVIDYLEFQGRLHGINPQNLNDLVRSAIEKTSLNEKATSSIQTLSRGYRQRVGVAQALLHMPDILILDEPTNGLDPNQIHQMRNLIKELAKSATIIVSTHVLQEVQAICERVLILRGGKLVLDSKISDLQSESKYTITTTKNDLNIEEILLETSGLEELNVNTNQKATIINFKSSEEFIPTIVKLLVDKKINITSVTPEKRNLETVFAEVSTEIK
jgi:ABC-2 type transport system ATP-binding protein